MRSPASAVRGGITILPSSSGRPAVGGMECNAYMVGYSRRKIASVGADMISKMLMTRSSTGTSLGCPRSAALFLAGWIVCIVSLAWQASGIGVHEHFNHNDIFHSIFFVGLAVVAAGLLARVAEDRRQAEDELKGVQV